MHVKTCTMQRIQRDQYKACTHTYLSILRGTQDITERLDNRWILVYHLELFGGLLKQYMKFLIIYMYMYMYNAYTPNVLIYGTCTCMYCIADRTYLWHVQFKMHLV